MTDRVTLLREDTARSASALAAAIDGAVRPDGLAGDEGAPVRFIGLGSSRFAALTVAAQLGASGRDARVEAASGRPAPARPGEVVFAVSASGRTPEVVDAIGRLGGAARVIAVTNDPESPLARAAPETLLLRAGEERAGIAGLSYRATLAVLSLATGAAVADDLRALLPRLADPAPADAVADLLDGAGSAAIDVVAPADRLGSAEQAALILREAPRLRAIAWVDHEWPHTAVYTALPGHRLLALGAGAATDAVVSIVEARGGRSAVFELGLEGVAAAIVESIAIERAAAVLWAAAGD